MLKYFCDDCDKGFKSKNGLNYHISQKICKRTTKKYKCPNCGATNFRYSSNYYRHINHTCKKKKENKKMLELIEKNNELMVKHQEVLELLTNNPNFMITNQNNSNNNSNNNNSNNNSNNNIQNNLIQNNINICSFGEENYDKMNFTRLINNILDHIEDGESHKIPLLIIKEAHIDTEENRNICISNVRNKVARVYINGKWIKKDVKDICEYLLRKPINHFNKYIIDNKDVLVIKIGKRDYESMCYYNNLSLKRIKLKDELYDEKIHKETIKDVILSLNIASDSIKIT